MKRKEKRERKKEESIDYEGRKRAQEGVSYWDDRTAHVIHVEHDLKSARKMIWSKGTRIILLACIFFFLILNNRNIYCPRKKKDSTHRFLYFYVQIFVYCIWKIFISYVVIYIRRYIKRTRNTDESNILCNVQPFTSFTTPL